MDVVGLGWGSDNPAIRQLFTARFVPRRSQAQLDGLQALSRRTTSAENARALTLAPGEVGGRELLAQGRVPTPVLHGRHRTCGVEGTGMSRRVTTQWHRH